MKYNQLKQEKARTGRGLQPEQILHVDETEKKVIDVIGIAAIEGIQGGVDTEDVEGASCSMAADK